MAQVEVLIMTDRDRFAKAKESLKDSHDRYNIGTYKEKSQHLLLKLFYEPCRDYHEVPFEGYVADILNSKGITEIQTVGFRNLFCKLTVFLKSHPVTVVYPVEERKRTCWIDPDTGEISVGRYRTYSKAKYKLLSELLSINELFDAENLEIHIVSMAVSSNKALDGYGPQKKKRATKLDTVPDELLDITIIKSCDDIRRLLPFVKGEIVDSKEISSALGLRRIPLWRAIKFLTIKNIIAPVDKKGNSIIYEVL